MEKYIITSDNVKIYYKIEGEGPALLLLHGNSQNSNIFKRLIKRLKGYYTCISIDTRGHGKSLFYGKKLSFNRLMQDVLEVVQAEDLKSINLLGFSDGANIAMLLASKYPTRINRLILNAGNSTYAGLYALVRFTVKFLNICAHMLRRPSPALQLLLEDSLQSMNELEKITAPTLVINGQFDVVKTSHAHDIARHIPNSQFCIIPWGSHLSFYFRPTNFSRIVRHFLEDT
ncbi:alpha/beta fold hydrolase [Lactococcus formosensis]|uniref:Alpha/beta hydrolase n=1 Tax=Lactococcus formosensis TaxID=1281486 RepID=A0A9X4P8F0_9LACT|nr:alpha/beta hydrolase [Lactococcus formosensis]MDG6143514.1 alpha/beta hydrolase [Lactococcus formosensis]MDG6155772.1 alpha/beta hydrolase [Lactococcus formosensis]MDG6160723.1 alpha/beta hydrolase [Lactococcus formosensis]MDG6166938.1 alpha/beta hydrolase [Lactococcus formosensis]MDG6173103.1 alpha/beta hydrolase [Lactococcus formosensis]